MTTTTAPAVPVLVALSPCFQGTGKGAFDGLTTGSAFHGATLGGLVKEDASSFTCTFATDLRDDAERVMRKNFPKSNYFVGASGRKDPWWKLW